MFLLTCRCTHVDLQMHTCPLLCAQVICEVRFRRFFCFCNIDISQTTYIFYLFLLGQSGRPYPGQIARRRVRYCYSVGVQVTRPSFSACAARPPLPRAVLQQRACRRVRTRERTTATLTWALSVVPSLTWARTTMLCGTCFSLVSHVSCL